MIPLSEMIVQKFEGSYEVSAKLTLHIRMFMKNNHM